MTHLVLQGAALDKDRTHALASAMAGTAEFHRRYHVIEVDQAVSPEDLAELRQHLRVDVNALPHDFDPGLARLVVMDMDSTLITIECVDELADFAGVKPQVAAITESAMRGEIDFDTSLRQRVRLLAGLPADTLMQVYHRRLALNPGAESLLDGLRQRGIKTALVSGGFTFFTQRLAERLAIDYSRANRLEIIDDKLSGHVMGEVFGRAGKADFLRDLCRQLGISPSQTVAVGDGANDLEMMKQAGLSVAYHAKPAVQAQAHTAILHGGLDGVLALLDIDDQGQGRAD